MSPHKETVIIAHRGHGPTSLLSGGPGGAIPSHIMPENTMKAFREAIRQGADGIEFDVHITGDDEVVVVHDDELNKNVEGANRNTRELGLISQKTLKEVQSYNVGQGEHIPTLRETLDLFVESNKQRTAQGKSPLIVNIELKGDNTTQKTANIANEYITKGYLGVEDFVFCAFKHQRLVDIRAINPAFRVAPNLKTAMLFGDHNLIMPGWHVREGAEYDPASLDKLRQFARDNKCCALDPVLWDVYAPLVSLAKEEGLGLYISTSDVRTFERQHLIVLLALEQAGISVFFKTDEPALARETLNELRMLRKVALGSAINYVTVMSTIQGIEASVVMSDAVMGQATDHFDDPSGTILSEIDRALKRPVGVRPPNYSDVLVPRSR